MIVEWQNFERRWAGRTREQFELLALLLFCHQFGKKQGVFRYANNPALETEPIQVGSEWVGFQAKYFENKISSHAEELKKCIFDAKTKYPNLTKIFFYLNLDLSCNDRGVDVKAKYQKDMESFASEKGVRIVWIGRGQLEVTLSQPEVSYIADYFFSSGEGVKELVDVLKQRTRASLGRIEIDFKDRSGKTIAGYARATEVKWLHEANKGSVSIIVGEAGIGKSTVVKLFHSAQLNDRLDGYIHLDALDAVELLRPETLAGSWHTSLAGLLPLFDETHPKILVIDSCEKLEGHHHVNDLGLIVKSFVDSEWKVVCTVRTLFAAAINDVLAGDGVTDFRRLDISPLPERYVDEVLSGLNVSSGNWANIKQALHIPMYLRMYVQTASSGDAAFSIGDWKNILWRRVVDASEPTSTVSATLIDLVSQRLSPGFNAYNVLSLPADDVKKLLSRNVLYRDDETERYTFSHDIFEEWALVKLMAQKAHALGDNFPFNIPDELPMRRAYRIWLFDMAKSGKLSDEFLLKRWMPNGVAEHWFDEMVLVLLQWNGFSGFLQRNTGFLLERNGENLMCLLARTLVVGQRRKTRLGTLNVSIDLKNANSFTLTEPDGLGWETLILFIVDHRSVLPDEIRSDIVNFMSFWIQNKTQGAETQGVMKSIGEFLLQTAREMDGESFRGVLKCDIDQIAVILSNCAEAIPEILRDYVQNGINCKGWRNCKFLSHYFKVIVQKSISHCKFIQRFPLLSWDIFKNVVQFNKQEQSRSLFGEEWRKEKLSSYGLSEDADDFSWRGYSAFITPTLFALNSQNTVVQDDVICFLNNFFNNYVRAEKQQISLVEFVLPDGTRKELFGGLDLWSAHRVLIGPALPHCVVCVLMALEKFLLKQAGNVEESKFEDNCLRMLSQANNVAVAGVLASVVLANERKFMKLALALFSCREALDYDYKRSCFEGTRVRFNYFNGIEPEDAFYKFDRDEEDKKAFRTLSLEFLMYSYQLVREGHEKDDVVIADKIHAILDGFYRVWKRPEDEAFKSRVDTRMLDHWEKVVSGGKVIGFRPISKISNVVQKLQEDGFRRTRPLILASQLMNWATFVSAGVVSETPSAQTKHYLDMPESVLSDVDELTRITVSNDDKFTIYKMRPKILATILLRLDSILGESRKDDFFNEVLSSLYAVMASDIPSGTILECKEVLRLSFSLFETLTGEYRARLHLALVLLLVAKIPSRMSEPFGMEFVLRDAGLSSESRHELAIAYFRLKSRFSVFCSKRPKQPLCMLLKNFLKEEESFVNGEYQWMASADRISSWEDWNLLDDLEGAAGVLMIIADKSPCPDDQKILIDYLKPVMTFVFAKENKGDIKREFSRSLSSWMIEQRGPVMERICNELLDVPHLLDSSSILDAIAIRMDETGSKEGFIALWRCFSSILCKQARNKQNNAIAKDVASAFLLTAYYWNPNKIQFQRIQDAIGEELIALFKEAFVVLSSHPSYIYEYARFFSNMGVKYCLEGIKLVSSALHTLEYEHGSDCSVLDNLIMAVVRHKNVEVHRNREEYSAMLSLLDFRVAQGSFIAFQVRETM